MKKCRDIENNLSLYLDDLLSNEDKAAVEEHLQSCPRCAKTLARLSKTKELTNSLNEVEPPPWFKQKIMARVREEAGKKSFIHKLFYPLQIKIPVQIFATVCIAVLAVYLYRAGEDRIQEIVPSSMPAPVIQAQNSQMPEQKEESSAAEGKKQEAKLMPQNDAPLEIARQHRDVQIKDYSEQAKIVRKKEDPGIKDFNAQTAFDRREDHYKPAAAKAPELSGTEAGQQEDRDISGTAMKTRIAPQALDSMTGPSILLKVSDLDVAVREADKILTKLEAKNITSRIMPGKAFFTVELSHHKIKDLLKELTAIGLVEEKHIPAADAAGNTALVLEITNH